jgi:hypothetical protein
VERLVKGIGQATPEAVPGERGELCH